MYDTSPYSFSYVAEIVFPGSLPGLRTGTNLAPSRSAITGANRNPRDSRPTIASIFSEVFEDEFACSNERDEEVM